MLGKTRASHSSARKAQTGAYRRREQRVEPVSEIRELNENVPDEISEPTESECEGFEEDQDLDIEMAM